MGKSFPDLPHTPANAQLYDAGMVVVSQKLSRKCSVNLGPVVCKSLSLSTRPLLLLWVVRFKIKIIGRLCFTSHQQRGHLETPAPFTVPCQGREAPLLHHSHRESNPRPSCGSPLHYRCATPATNKNKIKY